MHRRHAIDFTSNSPNMTTVTCQRSRIVSPVGIVPIRRYIFVAFRDFFPKTAGRRTASENDQASITRGPSREEKRAKTASMPRRRAAAKVRHRFSVIFSGLRHLTAFRHYQEPINMSRLFILRRDSRAARICLSKRTPVGCCLDIVEKRRCRTAWNLPRPWKDKNITSLLVHRNISHISLMF